MFLLIVACLLVMIVFCSCVLKIVFMNKILTIRVICPDIAHPGQEKELYRNNIEIDDNVSIPFSVMIEAFKVLYNKAGAKVVFGYEL